MDNCSAMDALRWVIAHPGQHPTLDSTQPWTDSTLTWTDSTLPWTDSTLPWTGSTLDSAVTHRGADKSYS